MTSAAWLFKRYFKRFQALFFMRDLFYLLSVYRTIQAVFSMLLFWQKALLHRKWYLK